MSGGARRGGRGGDGCRIGWAHENEAAEVNARSGPNSRWADTVEQSVALGDKRPHGVEDKTHPAGRWPANVVLDEQAAALLDAEVGERASNSGKPFRRADVGYHGGCEPTEAPGYYGDSGGVSRFFYTAKAGADEREGSKHPTVKPLALMRWLVRLVTPPGGVVLDPFAGSGTTLRAAREEGFRATGIEREAEYLADAAHRLRQLSLLGEAS